MKEKKPSLLFGPGDVSGWTPVGISSFHGMKPTAAIRELIQNSLDAAVDVGEEVARMRFCIISQCPMNDIPAIRAYRNAFEKATSKDILDSVPPTDNSRAITDEIRACLGRKTCDILYVLDNGIGLNKERMQGLLSDGISIKSSDATGSYGNGHIVAFPASNLRYILYGGLADGQRIASGHAILASRRGDKKSALTLSKDGYFVKGLHGENLFKERYTFPENDEIPIVINKQLDWIDSNWGHGSVVMIPGFNYFREESENFSLTESVFRAAACNFFEAIYQGKLIIEVDAGETRSRLDKNTLFTVLDKYKEEKRSSDLFLSGSKAYETFLTLRDGRSVEVKTDIGIVEVIVRCPVESARTKLDLCRNGMWITGDIPGLRAHQFGKVKPFHGILPLRRNKEFNRLVRKSEGPLHNECRILEKLNSSERKQLTGVFRAIRERLRKEIPDLEVEVFRPDDIFVLPRGGLLSGGTRPSKSGTATAVRRGKPSKSEGDGSGGGAGDGTGTGKGSGSGGRKSGEFKRGGSYIPTRALVIHTGPRSCDVEVAPETKAKMGEVRFALDENLDVTSDGLSQEAYVSIDEHSVLVNQAPVSDQDLVRDDDGRIKGILLGEMDSEKKYVVKMSYTVPADLPVDENQQPVLIVELMSRQARKREQGD